MNWIPYAESWIPTRHDGRWTDRIANDTMAVSYSVASGGPALALAVASFPAVNIASAIFEHAVDAMLVLDDELTVRLLNPSAEQLLRWHAADVVGKLECRQLLSCRRDSPWFLGEAARGECLCATARHRPVPEAALQIRPRPGESRLVAASGTPLPLGQDRGILLVMRPSSYPQQARCIQLSAGSLQLDLNRHEVSVGGRRLHLTPIEFALLRYLLAHRERVVSRQELLEQVWNYHFDDGSAVVKVHIGSLRHALKSAAVTGMRITNVYGVGYMLTTQS